MGAIWFRCIGVVGGEEAITIEHIDRMCDDVAPDWPKSRAGGIDGVWHVIIEGEPSFDAEFEVGFNAERGLDPPRPPRNGDASRQRHPLGMRS